MVFADGSEERADVVVYGTGYKVSFPFFDPALVSAPDNDLPLYRRVFHPDLPGLYFIALLQPLGATMPLAEAQSEWVCDHLTGRYALPPRAELLADIARERAAHAQALRRLQAPHDAGRLRRLPVRAQAGAQARREARLSRREATKEANRAAILAAAREVFAEHGYEGAGVRDVIRRTDLASGTFYNYFDGKDAVFRAVVEEVGADARRRVREARLAGAGRRFVAEGFRAFFAFIAAEPETFAFLERNKDAVLPLALAELERGPRRRGCAPGVDASLHARTRWSPWGWRSAALMLAREPADVDRATAFAAGLFRGLLR